MLDKAIAGADKTLTKAHEAPLPDGLTPHKLRHTFASILVALGVDPGSVMDQLGHADPAFTLRIYRHGMRRDPAAKLRLRALVKRNGSRKRRARRFQGDQHRGSNATFRQGKGGSRAQDLGAAHAVQTPDSPNPA